MAAITAPVLAVMQRAAAQAVMPRYQSLSADQIDAKAADDVKGRTEMEALIAYLQMLGTLVDFKLYNEKANLR